MAKQVLLPSDFYINQSTFEIELIISYEENFLASIYKT